MPSVIIPIVVSSPSILSNAEAALWGYVTGFAIVAIVIACILVKTYIWSRFDRHAQETYDRHQAWRYAQGAWDAPAPRFSRLPRSLRTPLFYAECP